MNGWIKLHRKLINDCLWHDCTPEQKVILITLLMMANHREKEWIWKGEKFKAKAGQFVTSIDSIKSKAGKGISSKNVRTALEKFERLGFLANQSAKTGRLITIINWEKYQCSDSEGGKDTGNQSAINRQSIGNQSASNKNVKNVKNERIDKVNLCHKNLNCNECEEPEQKALIYLINIIKQNNQRAKVPEQGTGNYIKWCSEMDKINRIGPPGGKEGQGYTWKEIKTIIDYIYSDSFWVSNILSAKKLREKIVTIENQMKRGFNNGKNGQGIKTNERDEKLEQFK